MHKTLERQLIRIYGGVELVPPESKKFIEVVSKTYTDYDSEYELVERSLEISSTELTESNERLREEISAANDRAEKLESLNNMMIDREIKMVELKKENKRLNSELNSKK